MKAVEKDGRRSFEFKVENKRLLQSLKTGQLVHANFETRMVSVRPDGAAPCCAIVSIRDAGARNQK